MKVFLLRFNPLDAPGDGMKITPLTPQHAFLPVLAEGLLMADEFHLGIKTPMKRVDA